MRATARWDRPATGHDANVARDAGPSGTESDAHEQRALGFWLHLMGDAVIFALLFMTYGIMVGNTDGRTRPARPLFSLNNAALETALLLVSSTTFGFASLSSRAGNRSAVLGVAAASPSLLGAGLRLPRDPRVPGHDRAGAGPTAAASCRPSSPWSAPTACMSASAWSGS